MLSPITVMSIETYVPISRAMNNGVVIIWMMQFHAISTIPNGPLPLHKSVHTRTMAIHGATPRRIKPVQRYRAVTGSIKPKYGKITSKKT